jgi:predicted phage-related endonuclease
MPNHADQQTSPKKRPARVERHLIVTHAQWMDLRQHDVTASVVGSLFGVHEYKSLFELWHEITGGPRVTKPPNELMERGTDFEEAIAKRVGREHPEWKIRKARHYYRDSKLRLGATPDFLMTSRDGHRGILQVKTVNPYSFKRRWTETIAPQWIILQTLTEMILTRSTWGIIVAAEIGDNTYRRHYYEVPRNERAERRIKETVAAFWRAVDAGEVPKPDYVRDGALIAAMTMHAKKGSIVDLRTDNRMPLILSERARLKDEIEKREAQLKALETEIKDKLGENETALVNGWTVKVPEVAVAAYVREVKAYSYRKINAKRDEAAPEPQPIKTESAA